MAEKRYFTALEIDALLPQLEHIFNHIQTCKTRAEELAAQMFKPIEVSLPSDVAQLEVLRSQVEFLMEAVQEDIHQIEHLGGIAKDVELGLVDFLGDVEGQDVWLCWKRGEPQVRFWHSLSGGFRDRRLIPVAPKNSTLH